MATKKARKPRGRPPKKGARAAIFLAISDAVRADPLAFKRRKAGSVRKAVAEVAKVAGVSPQSVDLARDDLADLLADRTSTRRDEAKRAVIAVLEKRLAAGDRDEHRLRVKEAKKKARAKAR